MVCVCISEPARITSENVEVLETLIQDFVTKLPEVAKNLVRAMRLEVAESMISYIQDQPTRLATIQAACSATRDPDIILQFRRLQD